MDVKQLGENVLIAPKDEKIPSGYVKIAIENGDL